MSMPENRSMEKPRKRKKKLKKEMSTPAGFANVRTKMEMKKKTCARESLVGLRMQLGRSPKVLLDTNM
jgi:hypothetical protein